MPSAAIGSSGRAAHDGEVGDPAVGVGVVGEHVERDGSARGETGPAMSSIAIGAIGTLGLDDLDRHEGAVGAAPTVADLVRDRDGLAAPHR